MTNIWDSFEFNSKAIEKTLDEKYSKIRGIIKEQINKFIGDVPDLIIRSQEDRVTVQIKHYTVVDILMKNEEIFIIRQSFPDLEVEFSLDVFIQYFPQIISSIIIPMIKKLYKQDYIKQIPDSLKDKAKINISKITPEWLKETFEDISEEYSNSERIEDIEIEVTDNGIKISFEVDCGRYGVHRDNTIKVSNKGDVKTNLSEIIEGGDLDGQLKEAIEELIKDGE